MTGQPRPAATVILVRDGSVGLETFVMRRASSMAFAPGMHVFPGGRVDPRDYEQAVVVSGDAAGHAARMSTDVAGMRALYACAVRETAEEVGVHLARHDVDGRLVIDAARLPLADHWVTPETEPRRYDVRFFVAELSMDADVRLTTTEADLAEWVRPEDALAQFRRGRMAMLPPTEASLVYLAGFDRAVDVVADAAVRPVIPLLPQRRPDPSGRLRWLMVNDRTGEVVSERIPAPHTREADGTAWHEDSA